MPRRRSVGLILIAALLVIPSPAATQAQEPTVVDAGFLREASSDGMNQVALADIAETNSFNQEIRGLAEQIRRVHEKTGPELAALAAKKGVTLPLWPTRIQSETRRSLGTMHGATFDKAYVNTMVINHRTSVAAFTERSEHADTDVKAFASRALQLLRDVLQRAETEQRKFK